MSSDVADTPSPAPMVSFPFLAASAPPPCRSGLHDKAGSGPNSRADPLASSAAAVEVDSVAPTSTSPAVPIPEPDSAPLIPPASSSAQIGSHGSVVPPHAHESSVPGGSVVASSPRRLPASPPGMRRQIHAPIPIRPQTRLQNNIRKPKTFTDGTVRYGLLSDVKEPCSLREALCV